MNNAEAVVKASWHGNEWILANVVLGDLKLVPFTRGRPSKTRIRYAEWLPKDTWFVFCRRGKPKGLPIPARFAQHKSWWFGGPKGAPIHRPLILIPCDGNEIPELTTGDPPRHPIGNIRLEGFQPPSVGVFQKAPGEKVLSADQWKAHVLARSAIHVLRDPLRVKQEGNWCYVVPPKPYLQGLRRLFSRTPLVVSPEEKRDAHGIPVRSWRAKHEELDPAVAIFTDGTNILYFGLPYVEPGFHIPGWISTESIDGKASSHLRKSRRGRKVAEGED